MSFGNRSVISGSCQTVQALRPLLQEHDLPALIAQAGKIAVIRPIEILLALAGAGAGQQVALIVAVEMDLEGLARGLIAGEQLFLDVRLARRRRPASAPSPRAT